MQDIHKRMHKWRVGQFFLFIPSSYNACRMHSARRVSLVYIFHDFVVVYRFFLSNWSQSNESRIRPSLLLKVNGLTWNDAKCSFYLLCFYRLLIVVLSHNVPGNQLPKFPNLLRVSLKKKTLHCYCRHRCSWSQKPSERGEYIHGGAYVNIKVAYIAWWGLERITNVKT